MQISTSVRLTALSLCFVSSIATAEWRCDCTTIVDSCSAAVTVRESWVDVTSTSQQCARVDYFIDGAPFVALVVGGEARQDWLARSRDPDILIQSCQVCLDHADDTPPPAPVTDDADAQLIPVIEVSPQYPPAAAAGGIEGFAEVSYTVTPVGSVEGAAVTSSEPTGVFDQAALASIARWRYTIDEEREPVTLSHRFEFGLDAALMALAPARVEPATARQTSAERNQCVRELASYNYGEMIEISLMNVCAEPVIVYTCAEGMGRFSNQWICGSAERSQEALVPRGDDRAGRLVSLPSPDGGADFRYTQQLFVARAPNSQYWWLACSVGDIACRESGDQWVRSVNRQLAGVDPQDRIGRPLARAN